MLRRDHLEHLIIGAAGTIILGAVLLSIGAPAPDIIAAAFFIGVFYGREERDHEIAVCKERVCNLAAIMLDWRTYAPWKFSRDGRWDFFCPLVGIVCVVAVWRSLCAAWRF